MCELPRWPTTWMYGAAFDKRSTYTVVGIVGNVKQIDLAETQELGAVYLPYVKFPKFQVIVRTQMSASAVTSPLEKLPSSSHVSGADTGAPDRGLTE